VTIAKTLWAYEGMIDGQLYWLKADGTLTDNRKEAHHLPSKIDAERFGGQRVPSTERLKWTPTQLPPGS
jgi:hypothetical protein